MSTITNELRVEELGEDGEMWFVHGTDDPNTVYVEIIKWMRATFGEADTADALDRLFACGMLPGSHWHVVEKPGTDPYYRLAEFGNTSRESFFGTMVAPPSTISEMRKHTITFGGQR